MRRERDKKLGEALRRLDVPEHAPDFFPRLWEAIEREPLPVSETESPRTGAQVTKRRRLRPPVWVALPAAALLLAVLWLAFSPGPLSERLGVPTAATVKAKVDSTVSGLRSLQGTLVIRADDMVAGVSEMSWDFAYTSRGDFRFSGNNKLANGATRPEELAHDSRTGVESSYSQEGSDPPVVAERSGLAAGEPDPRPADWVLQRELGSVVRAFLDIQDPRVLEATLQGQPVWVLEGLVQPNWTAPISGDRLEVIVDQ